MVKRKVVEVWRSHGNNSVYKRDMKKLDKLLEKGWEIEEKQERRGFFGRDLGYFVTLVKR